MTTIRHNGSPAVCPTGTTSGRDYGRAGVACWVQNQNQNQTVVTTAVVLVVAPQIQVQSVPRGRFGFGGAAR